ncbi:carboxymuconolactone decarboxylase family protein [Amycolatopsis cynarae]|uniref:Carboxymuconolactone decarboxylase family protein n=1 Tax=Amycolatopsis cynarae TaxID=2995223 RepID=A0ABY7B9I7_9PSEU|nr:carboxymuconolactone decarboxylase family protein [Amycolatopsis sp. HUAS 11-8]WAL68328.1 carboxymuconolactone decarboxylase family protein [Amycolatopsis sp. HUAS 11-8]
MSSKRQQGLDMMKQVYGWSAPDVPGDYLRITVEHLFADIWTRPGLSLRDRRLLLLGVIAAQGLDDIAAIQVNAALHNEELDEEQLREIALFLTHYVGWPLGSRLNTTVEKAIAQRARQAEER